MTNVLRIDDFTLSYTIIKYKKIPYLITTPHGIFIEKDKIYRINYQDNIYRVQLHKQSYWCDLAIFKFIDKIKIKSKEVKILKAHSKLYNLRIHNKKKTISGIIEDFCYHCHLNINGGNRILFYQMKSFDKIEHGDSGTGFYSENKLIGLISKCDDNIGLIVPAFYIFEILNRDNNLSPHLPLKLKMDGSKVVLAEKYYTIPEGFEIKKFDNLIVNNGNVYCFEVKDNIPIDVYLQIYGKIGNQIKISNDKKIYKLVVKDLNTKLKYPFISNVSLKEKEEFKNNTYQDIWFDITIKNTKKYDLMENNLIV